MASLPTRLINFTTIQCVFISILWVGLFCVAEVEAGGDLGAVFGRLGNKQREFDYFKLALQWPGTACRGTSRCCSSNACCRRSNAVTEFTIHGLWPDYNDGTWPACCSGKRFDVKERQFIDSDKELLSKTYGISPKRQILTFLNALNKYWPSLSCDSPSDCHGGKGLFWEHEWEKHGTCSSPVVQDEYDYFVTTLNLYFKYNVTDVLREAGYVASNSEKYPLGGIISAIQDAFHATPELQCSGDAVEELRLCFYKDFKIRDCATRSNSESGMINSETSCPKYIILPEFVSLKVENNGIEASESTLRSAI